MSTRDLEADRLARRNDRAYVRGVLRGVRRDANIAGWRQGYRDAVTYLIEQLDRGVSADDIRDWAAETKARLEKEAGER
jgi:hypothetical protein